MPEQKRPGVGIAVFIRRSGQILWGKRKNAHGAGMWCVPGGHLEFGEDWEHAVTRETKEETGLEIKNAKFATAINSIFEEEGRHYVTIFMVADYASGEEKVMEPDKCEEWQWRPWDDLPQPLFYSEEVLRKRRFDPFNEI